MVVPALQGYERQHYQSDWHLLSRQSQIWENAGFGFAGVAHGSPCSGKAS